MHTHASRLALGSLLALAAAGGALVSASGGSADDGIPIYTASTITVNKPGQTPSSGTPSSAPVNLSRFLGAWRTWVPGGTYVTPGTPGSGTDVLHTSAGAKGTALVIKANHRWTWKGKTGAWKATGDSGYPLLLVRALDGHDWKVGVDVKHRGQIVIWDGYTWYLAKH